MGQDPGFAHFYGLCVDACDDDDLASYAPQALEAVLRPVYLRLGQRGAAPHLITLRAPERDGPHRGLLIDIQGEDRPFLVDSVLGTLRAAGFSTRFLTHPILPVDRSGPAWQVLDPEAEAEAPHYESVLVVETDPVGDAARLAALTAELDAVLVEVARVTAGWRPMLERLRSLVQGYRRITALNRQSGIAEALQFLAWLADHNFTFLGMRDYRLTGEGESAALAPVEGTGLGILADPAFTFLRSGSDYVEMTPRHVAFLGQPEPLLVTKANRRSRVHRRAHMDYVGAKLYDEDGKLSGELRILGLFTSQSLSQPHRDVPYIRRKLAAAMNRSGLEPRSHAGKALMAALETYPRDELFQIGEDDLFAFAVEIASLTDRPRLKLLPRLDPFDNFVSALVFVPRDRYSAAARAEIGAHLAVRYDGRVSDYTPHFLEGELVRIHYIIGRAGGPTPRPDRYDLEAEIADLLRPFGDRLAEAALDPASVAPYRDAFPAAYQARYGHRAALADIGVLRTLSADAPRAVRLTGAGEATTDLALKFYQAGAPIALSDRVPMLEHFGFCVIDETTYVLTPRDRPEIVLHDMIVRLGDDIAFSADADAARLEDAVLAALDGRAESDPFNRLVLYAGLSAAETLILRAYGRYMRQIGLGFSETYLAAALGRHPAASAALIKLFFVRLDPAFTASRADAERRLCGEIDTVLARVAALDDDRIIRHFRNLILATLRSNFFVAGPGGTGRAALAFKFDATAVDGLPAPRPTREIFVTAPRFEGVHLRFGAIARGGIRWSDRPEDFRSEILALAKAQDVKNAIIVPVGAKGGFVLKLLPATARRDQIEAEAATAYEIFVTALLEVTDTIEGANVVAPARVVRNDGDDPYLVIAPDKGTAAFSDRANRIAERRGFWLGDAFASGGATGYDHKKMGITARGAWEAVRRHFRELGRDIATESLSVIGVGDMSGDVFGNFMLLSRKIRLVAAFDHRDIFIDPNPDPELGYMERKRLFELGRSSWQDYAADLISPGGGVYSRRAKSVALSPEARAALGIAAEMPTPSELIRLLLGAEIDLLWFGGIGTYVRAPEESDVDIADHGNDALRLNADEVRARVVGEGANLAVTQRGRVALARRGVRVNTDAIDNSAGVNASDLEVNIKIALGTLIKTGEIDRPTRDALMAEMTDEVAALCLENTKRQSLALSLAERRAAADLPDQALLIERLERHARLDRKLAVLPDQAGIAALLAEERGLTRPELAVLMAHAKIHVTAELLASPVPDDSYLGAELARYFPALLVERKPHAVEQHRLKREIIATTLSNDMINRCGPAFVERLVSATHAGPAEIARAYAAARDAFDAPGLLAEIDRLDTRMEAGAQLALYAEIEALLGSRTLWFLRNVGPSGGLAAIIEPFRAGIVELGPRLGALLPAALAELVADRAEGFAEAGVPRDLARRIAELPLLALVTDIVRLAQRHGAGATDAASAYFGILALFDLGQIATSASPDGLTDRFDRMAFERALGTLMRTARDLAGTVLMSGEGPLADRFEAWHLARAGEIDRFTAAIADLVAGAPGVSRLTVAAGLLADLMRS